MTKQLQAFLKNESGATAIEYLFMASLIIVVLVAAIQYVASKTNTLFQKADTSYPTEQQGP